MLRTARTVALGLAMPLVATAGYKQPLRIGIAVAYFPAILCLLFLEGLFLDTRLYQNNF
jgi:hypothetical protein